MSARFPVSATPAPKTRFLDQVRETIRRKHYSLRTESTYIDWIKRYIFFHGKRHPAEMGAPELERFLNYLAVERKVAAATQNQALSALVFLYHEVLRQDFEWLANLERAKKPARLPVVLTEAEVRQILAQLDGRNWLMASLLYGAGLRLMECVRLRVKDVDFDYRQITLIAIARVNPQLALWATNIAARCAGFLATARLRSGWNVVEGG
jgi:integrase